MVIVAEIRAAVGGLTALGALAAGAPAPVRAAALAWYPVVGLALGGVGVAVACAVDGAAGGVLGVLAIAVAGGLDGPRGLAASTALVRPGAPASVRAGLRAAPDAAGIALALTALGARAAAAATLPGVARLLALALAPLLGAWAVVVQCHGGAPGAVREPNDALVGRARFREFGAASVTAFALALGLADALGLALLVAAAVVTLAVRLLAHRRAGGLTGRLVAGTRELVETAVLVTAAWLAALLR